MEAIELLIQIEIKREDYTYTRAQNACITFLVILPTDKPMNADNYIISLAEVPKVKSSVLC